MFNNKLVNILLIVLAGYVILSMVNSNYDSVESFNSCSSSKAEFDSVEKDVEDKDVVEKFEAHEIKEEYKEPIIEEKTDDAVKGNSGCEQLARVEPSDLLPGNKDSWGSSVDGPDSELLDAGYHLGRDTVGQSLRNANLSIRAEPPNPRTNVSPWMNTTIDPDLMRNNICPA